MNTPNDQLFRQVEILAKSVKDQLRKKGIVPPSRGNDGSYIFDNYKIKKEKTGFYSILNSKNETVVDKINLPQTAAVLANDLALGKWIDDKLVALDTNYGYKDFDCQVFRSAAARNKKKDFDLAICFETRCKIADSQRKMYKGEIIRQFDKLRRLR
jgi:hypothetical protein